LVLFFEALEEKKSTAAIVALTRSLTQYQEVRFRFMINIMLNSIDSN